ncbi:hypothetical protein BDB01DRAFT_784489 [Pilobolus umbonatus]|nr:hypothetical protein BDB01DRAFT_784489 [Pilobolus umbonatus]
MSTEKQTGTQMDDLMCCGRRMFLASLMVASKYLHDKNYHNKTWCKITGLDIKQINASEMAFLKLIDYRLHVSKPTFDKWYTQLHGHLQKANTSESPISKPCPNNILPSPPYSDPKPIHSVSEREKKNAEDTNKQWLLMSPPYTQSEGLPSKKRESSILRVDHVHMEVKRLRQ